MSEEMSNYQFEVILKLIIQIIKDTDDKDEIIKKIEALMQ